MYTNKNTLLRSWTTRYLITLCIGLLVIGIVSTMWITYNQRERQINSMKFIAAEISERVVDAEGNLQFDPLLPRFFDRRQDFLNMRDKPLIFILDEHKQLVFGKLPPFLNPSVLQTATAQPNSVDQITVRQNEKIYYVSRKIESRQRTVGWVVLLSPERDNPMKTDELQLLVIMLVSLGLLGWIVIYLLTRKLAQPIKEVADAAKEIVAGNYNILLDTRDVREKELVELIHSFKDMADRLGQLERMRTELLAGVTHELKTPLTSISGLVQAVKDDIVTGEEAKEFLDICTRETSKLQKMVEDLLEFNSFAVGDITIFKESLEMNDLLQEITQQWRLAQEQEGEMCRLVLEIPDDPILTDTDPLRVQQIIYNLLNNAKHAINEQGTILVSLQDNGQTITIDVTDNGSGIPEAEQQLIFEKFFRGEKKKHSIRGLGLGLPFSRLMAHALGGSLQLTESNENRTTFTLRLPK
ncbi:HAMP domain-containing sensor histidine kinase [Brevibacillus dissolubilis]|uniref:HAMP domain-containing sensor histidine kinase n=1 Tax=Brevibacillus dissolubilis TaxID=1844116 RepID=UPI002100077E|nr:HAMP domain-containing sensor histidine kinase [Brevibacillus dissolubilis]